MSDYSHPSFGLPSQSPFDILKQSRSQQVALEPAVPRNADERASVVLKPARFGISVTSREASDRTNSIRFRSMADRDAGLVGVIS